MRRFIGLAVPLLLLAACSQTPEPARIIPGHPAFFPPMEHAPFLGLRTVIYRVPDMARARAWYASALAMQPYFDEPFYVGFNVGGFELGLQPDTARAPGGAGGVAYWGVNDADGALARLLGLGATLHEGVRDVGGGIRVATVRDPFGNVLGIIQNPNFRIAPAR
jgi:predicted enzyme related to lactoylglutathione lyase